MENKNEKLKELLSDLLDEEQAVQAERDICAGDELLSKFPSPKPDAVVVSSIKKKVASKLWVRKRRRVVRRSSEVVAAAILVIGVLLGLTFIDNSKLDSLATIGSVSEWSISDDAEYSLMVSEVEEIEGRIISIQMDEDDTLPSNRQLEFPFT